MVSWVFTQGFYASVNGIIKKEKTFNDLSFCNFLVVSFNLLDNFSTDKLPKKLSLATKEWHEVYKAAQLEFEKGANVLICNK